MKIRTDFVTNSSSSSFTLIINVGLKNGNVLSSGKERGDSFDDMEITALGSPLYLAHAKNISELAELIKGSFFRGAPVDDCPYDGEKFYDNFYPVDVEAEPLFSDEDSFIKDIKKVKHISDIEFIEVIGNTGEDWGDFLVVEKYRINIDDFSYTCEKEGEFFDCEGVDGKISFDDDYNESERCACCSCCGDSVPRKNAYIGKWSFGLYCSKECYEEGLRYNKEIISETLEGYELL